MSTGNGNTILAGLTPPQLEAVTHMRGPMLVVAGAGSGKTRVVTCRIAHLLDQGVFPGRILAMTFTNKAAGEMRRRVAELTGMEPRWIGTFHSICARMLRMNLDQLGEGRDRRFSILDDDEQRSLVKSILKEQGAPQTRPRAVLSRISRLKSSLDTPAGMEVNGWFDEIVRKTAEVYERRLREMNALDFDDLLLLTVRLLERCEQVREGCQQRFRFLLVDEYQDTNRAQYRLMRLLAGPERNVHATGDPDQSIYSWRGADYRNIMEFQRDFPGARLVRLERNYRSTKVILEAANTLIRHNRERIEKELFTHNAGGERLRLAVLDSEREEGDWVASMVARQRAAGRRLREMAVFYRTNAQSRGFEEAFMSAGITYQIVGGVRFYQRREIKDFLAHLKLMVNPRDEVALARVIACRPTGVGPKTLQALLRHARQADLAPFDLLRREDFEKIFRGRCSRKLKDFARWCARLGRIEQAPLSACVQRALEVSGLVAHIDASQERDHLAAERLENLQAFVNRALEFAHDHEGADLAAFLQDVALVADVDTWDPEADQLTLMTLHAAKGLEFPVVFVVGLEEGLLPHKNSLHEPDRLEEERRLFYVGLTRAREQVFLSCASWRFDRGEGGNCVPSRFLLELPRAQLELGEGADDSMLAGCARAREEDWDCVDEEFDPF